MAYIRTSSHGVEMGRVYGWSIKKPLKPPNSLVPVEDEPPTTFIDPFVPSNSTPTVQPKDTGDALPIYEQGPFNPEIPPFIDPQIPPWMLLGPPYSQQLIDVGRQGSILFRGAKSWTTLGPSTAKKVLTTQGPGADPTWETRV